MSARRIDSLNDLLEIKDSYNTMLDGYKHQILVCGGAGCISSGCAEIQEAVAATLNKLGMTKSVKVIETGCIGSCSVGPVMLIQPEGIFYVKLTPDIVEKILTAYLVRNEVWTKYTFYDNSRGKHIPSIYEIDFFRLQVQVALRNCGAMDHASIEAYIARDGYRAAVEAVTQKTSQDIVDQVKESGLMGRGGAGFPTGLKWEAGLKAKGEQKYIVCNADEGDPGAFMDRSIIEGDSHSLIEGMLLGGYAINATQGFIYIRAEYPLAIERLTLAIEQAREYGIIGKNLFGTNFDFDLEIRIGAGAFVCGEETALMSSIEGNRGEPRQKPPFPFQSGLYGAPTIINNVETFANVPYIILDGAEWEVTFRYQGNKGTKVFALAGDIANTGIVEVPIGVSLGHILFDIGGGIPDNKAFKAAQIGGPSGGCITKDNLNTPTDYNSLKELGAIMGSGGLIVMNEDTCMVDTARYFMDFIQDESCGKCVACRIGTKRMLEILNRICEGHGEEGDIEALEELGATIQKTAMCGLGQTAPNPVLSAIRYFRDEFEEHIRNKRCRAGVCSEMFISPCENTCPAGINVPGYTYLVAEGRFAEAYSLIRQENPFPAVCGRICTHPCESKCRRRYTDEAVAICDIKRFVADYAYKREQPFSEDVVFPKNGKSVAILGAGAAGLTCGYYLARLGYTIDIYESEKVAGGVLVYGIPEYRLPKDVLGHEIGLIEKEGVNIHLNTTVGDDIKFDTIQATSDAIFIATGAQFPVRINIPGEYYAGVIHGISFLKAVNLKKDITVGKKVVVVGGGNTAIDSARVALRMGAEKVTIIYRRTQSMMPASETEIHEALQEGVEIMDLTQPIQFLAVNDHVCKIECVKMALGDFDRSGRHKSVAIGDSNFFIDADMVIPAISQHADFPFIPTENIGITPWGTCTVEDDSMMTTMPGVFAGGDVVHGPDTVIQAVADGKKAAIAIDKYLGGKGILNKGKQIEINPVYDDDELVELARYPLDMLDIDKRINTFDEVVLGYHKLTAIAESMRCLHCERR